MIPATYPESREPYPQAGGDGERARASAFFNLLFMALRFYPSPMSLRDRFWPSAKPAAPSAREEARAALVLAGKRGRQSIAPAPKAGKAVTAVLRPLLRDVGMGFNEVKRRWAEIAGESFARATPEKLAAGVLTLKAPGALAPFLQSQTPLLMERLRLAGAKVKAIRIEQRTARPAAQTNLRPLRRPLSPAEDAALAQALDPVGDAGLKSALLRLGRAVGGG